VKPTFETFLPLQFFSPFFPGSWNPPSNFGAPDHYLHFVQNFRNRPFFLTAAKNFRNKDQTVKVWCSMFKRQQVQEKPKLIQEAKMVSYQMSRGKSVTSFA